MAMEIAITDDPDESEKGLAAEFEEFTSSVFLSSDSDGEGNKKGSFNDL